LMAARIPGPGEKRPDRLASAIPLSPRRHAQNRVLPEQRDEAVEIVAFPCTDITFNQRALPVVRRWLGVGPTCGEPLFKLGTGALESAVDRRERGIEQPGSLDGRPTQHIA